MDESQYYTCRVRKWVPLISGQDQPTWWIIIGHILLSNLFCKKERQLIKETISAESNEAVVA